MINSPPGSFSLFAVDDDAAAAPAAVADEFDDDVLDDEYDGVPELFV